jgi:hypothetical protein
VNALIGGFERATCRICGKCCNFCICGSAFCGGGERQYRRFLPQFLKGGFAQAQRYKEKVEKNRFNHRTSGLKSQVINWFEKGWKSGKNNDDLQIDVVLVGG